MISWTSSLTSGWVYQHTPTTNCHLNKRKIEEVEEQVPFSSHEGEEEEDGALREGDQEKKKRKRDVKFDEKHPKD
jgi:hypothetical protein